MQMGGPHESLTERSFQRQRRQNGLSGCLPIYLSEVWPEPRNQSHPMGEAFGRHLEPPVPPTSDALRVNGSGFGQLQLVGDGYCSCSQLLWCTEDRSRRTTYWTFVAA